MPLEKRHVSQIGAKRDVKHVAEKRYRADTCFNGDVERHARDEPGGCTQPPRFPHDVTGNCTADEVACNWNEANQTREAHANVGAGDEECSIHQRRERVQPLDRVLKAQAFVRIDDRGRLLML